ncbi:MAG: zf-HC2 domain-containing protein [Planctomycetes bacterium]|nr:zf-HC2 domain-containing protein [Planctomycetota bacterium]
MNCSEIRDYLFAFLDSELDAPLSIELQRHLDRCPECAREAEIERSVGRRLAAALGVDRADVVGLDGSVRRVMRMDGAEDASAAVVRRSSGWRYASAAAILLAVGAASWHFMVRSSSSHAPERFVDLMVSDLEHFLEEGKPLQFASADPAAVSSWLLTATSFPVSLPSTASCSYELLGGRKCKIDGRSAAFAMYDANGTPASLVVVAETEAMLDGMTHVRGADGSHWVERCKGHTVVARRRGSLVYAAASTLSEEDLLCLMTETIHEGD